MMGQPQDRRARQTNHDQAAFPTQMPLTAVRWYRMAINSIHLGTTMTRWLSTSGAPPPISLAPSLEAAANMIFYLSAEAETGYPPNIIMRSMPPRQFNINAPAMVMLRFAIDPYWACHAFAAVFLALLYDRGAIDGRPPLTILVVNRSLLTAFHRRFEHTRLARSTDSTSQTSIIVDEACASHCRYLRHDLRPFDHSPRCTLPQDCPEHRTMSGFELVQS